MSQNYILFFSRSCDKSFEVLDILRQNEVASRQILKANIEDPNIQIPPFIRNMKTPILLIHNSNSPRPEIYQGQDCFQAILHAINKISFFPKHQQKNAQSYMPPQPTGSLPRQANFANSSPPAAPQMSSQPPQNSSNGLGGGAGGSGGGLNMEALGTLGMYEASSQISNSYTLINDSDFVQNHDHQYSRLVEPQQRGSGGQGGQGGQQQQAQKTQFDREYERMMQQRTMDIPKPLERK